MKVLILGLGSSGGGAEAAEYYLKLGHSVDIIGSPQKRESEPMVQLLEEKGASFITKDGIMDAVDAADLVVKIPGVPIPYLVKRRAKRITNDIAALLENPRTERMTRIVIAGAKGKTSTASALSDALNEMGIRAAFSEGLGYSAFHLLSDIENDDKLYDAVIIEMSAWQVKDTALSLGYSWPRIDIAAITDSITIPTSPSDMTQEGALFIGPWVHKLIIPRFLKEKMLFSGIIPKAKVQGYPSIGNPYRSRPGMELAYECMKAMGFRRKQISKALSGYRGLIVGGTDKSNIDAEELMEPLDEAVSVTLLSGSLTEKLLPLVRRSGLRFSGPFEKMEEAVASAYGSALGHRGTRDTSEIILLSPGAYADEYFANEFERGSEFRQAVQKLLSEKR